MRLKTLRRPRPAFETEGACISGNKIDLTNDIKTKYSHTVHHTDSIIINNNNDSSRQTTNRSPKNLEQIRQTFSASTNTTPLASYQAIEAAYLEHGIRIHILKNDKYGSSTIKTANENTSSVLTTNSKPIVRHKAFLYKKQPYNSQQRSTSVLQYSTNDNGIAKLESSHTRPFSELQTTTSTMTDDFDKSHILNVSYAIDQQPPLEKIYGIHSSSFVASENLDIAENIRSTLTLTGTAQLSSQLDEEIDNVSKNLQETYSEKNFKYNEDIVQSLQPFQQEQVNVEENIKEEDPDLVYMYDLLKKNTGDIFTDSIRRRAGLRNTFAVHRRSSRDESDNNKVHLNKHFISRTNTEITPRSSLSKFRISNNYDDHDYQQNMNIQNKSTTTVTQKKIEKDIVKHASRIKTTQSKDYYSLGSNQNSQNRLLSSHTNSTSNIQMNFNQQQNNKYKTRLQHQLTSVSLEPLQLLLNPPPRQESSIKHLRSSSLLNKKADELPEITISSFNSNPLVEHSPRRLKKTIHRKRSSTHQTPKTDFTISSHTDDLLLTTKSSFNDSLPSTYKKELTVVTVNDIDGHSSSLDSGYDRSDSQSIVSGLSTVQNSSSLRSSARLTNSSSLVRHKKKVSFGDEAIAYA